MGGRLQADNRIGMVVDSQLCGQLGNARAKCVGGLVELIERIVGVDSRLGCVSRLPGNAGGVDVGE